MKTLREYWRVFLWFWFGYDPKPVDHVQNWTPQPMQYILPQEILNDPIKMQRFADIVGPVEFAGKIYTPSRP